MPPAMKSSASPSFRPAVSAGFLLLLAAFCWAAYSFSSRSPLPYDVFSPSVLLSFHAPLPQGRRLFSLAFARFFLSLGFSPGAALFASETAAAAAFLFSLRHIFMRFASPRAAVVAAVSAIILLPPLFGTFYFQPWDTWLMAFLSWALVFILEARFLPLLVLMPFASLNHESAALIPLLFLAVHVGRLPISRSRRSLFWIGLALLAIHATILYLAATWTSHRAIANFYAPADTWAGMVLRHPKASGGSQFNWLFNLRDACASPLAVPALLVSVSFLPPAWLLLWRFHTPESRRCALVALFHVASVFVTGFLFETRCWAATLAILYPLVAIALFRALGLSTPSAALPGLPPIPEPAQRILSRLEILALVLLPLAVVAFIAIEPLLLPPA